MIGACGRRMGASENRAHISVGFVDAVEPILAISEFFLLGTDARDYPMPGY